MESQASTAGGPVTGAAPVQRAHNRLVPARGRPADGVEELRRGLAAAAQNHGHAQP